MPKYPKNIIIMKVGPHSSMSLDEIIISKREEELIHGVHYWGYSGVFCQPKPTQVFCKDCLADTGVAPVLVLLETKSPYESSIGMIKHYSTDGINYQKFDKPVQLQGAQFSFVAKNLRLVRNFPLDLYEVVGGKNHGKGLLEHLRFRVNKSLATLTKKPELKKSNQTATVLVADLAEPFAIWLKN